MSKKKCKEIEKTNNKSVLITISTLGCVFVLILFLNVIYGLNKWDKIPYLKIKLNIFDFAVFTFFCLVVLLIVFFVLTSSSIKFGSDEYKKLKCKKVLKKDVVVEDE